MCKLFLMQAIIFQCAEIAGVSSRRDHSARFSVVTQELAPEAAATLLSLHGSNVSCLLTPLDTEPEATVEVKAKAEVKTPSQRMRSVLFAIHRETGSKEDFDAFYNRRMNTILSTLKSELDNLKS